MSQLDLFRAPHRRLMPTAAPDSKRRFEMSPWYCHSRFVS